MVTDDSIALGKALAARRKSAHLSKNLPYASERPMCNPSIATSNSSSKCWCWGARQTSLDLHLLTNLLGGFQQDLTSVLPPYFDDGNKEGLVIISEAKCDQVLAICQALSRLFTYVNSFIAHSPLGSMLSPPSQLIPMGGRM